MNDEKDYVFLIDDGEQHWIAANSEDEALELHYSTLGYNSKEEWLFGESLLEEGDYSVTRLDDDLNLTITDEDDGLAKTLTCREWADLMGPGIIGTTAY